MATTLQIHAHSRAETWHDTLAGLCRVHVGVDNPEPQPLFSRDRTKCIVLSGECFDYEGDRQELVRRGHTFDLPANDAELVLRLWEEYGERGLGRLSGSFCFAIYDGAKQDLYLVSDRLASRPLFYGLASDGRLYFATQVSAVLQAGDVNRALDLTAVLQFCALQRVVGTRTYHEGVRVLPPASVLRYRAGRVTLSPYWRPEYRPERGSANEYAEELASTMRRASRRLWRGGARPALLLSGGLDARMVAAAAEGDLPCYTFGDYLNPEVEAAREVAAAADLPFHFLERPADHYASLLDAAVEIGGGMYAFNHAHAVGFLDDIASQCDVVTHGFAPELLFRGTSLPKVDRRLLGVDLGARLDRTLHEGNLEERLFQRGYSLLGSGVAELLAPGVADRLRDTLAQTAREVMDEARAHASNVYDQFLWPDVYYHARYPSMLFELSLRPYMTERSLFLDNQVLDLHLRMPLEMRTDSTVWVKALRRLNPRVAAARNANTGYAADRPGILQAGASAARDLAARLPLLGRLEAQRLARRRAGLRAGLSPISWPRFDWLVRNNPALRGLIDETLRDSDALPDGIFIRDRVAALLDAHLAGRGHHRTILFMLLTLGRWHKRHGPHTSGATDTPGP